MTIATLCCSHSPLMLGFYQPADSAAEEKVRGAFAEQAAWIAQYAPDLIVVFGPDHYNGFFYDLMPPFCIGARAEATTDWDIEPGTLDVPSDFALACVDAVRKADIDVALSWKMKVDHGTTIPLNYLTRGLDHYPVLPIVINCVAPPLPSFRRARLLGEAVGRYLATLDGKILIIGSGGLSHDPPTPRLAEAPPEVAQGLIERRVVSKQEYDQRQSRVIRSTTQMLQGEGPCLPPSEEWDRQVLDRFMAGDLAWFDGLDDAEVNRVAGHGGHEVRCWLAALAAGRAAADLQPVLDCYQLVPEWLTGMGLMRALPKGERP
jgi:2,3-dihydroxyphenylpropionate 1,2-dioxygenase